VIRRTFRLHQNGRTLLSWWVADSDWPTFPPVTRGPADHLQLRFDGTPPEQPEALVMHNGGLMYRFVEEVEPAARNAFHKVEFLFDNDLWVIEYRRDLKPA
jgi:hypothetical protein